MGTNWTKIFPCWDASTINPIQLYVLDVFRWSPIIFSFIAKIRWIWKNNYFRLLLPTYPCYEVITTWRIFANQSIIRLLFCTSLIPVNTNPISLCSWRCWQTFIGCEQSTSVLDYWWFVLSIPVRCCLFRGSSLVGGYWIMKLITLFSILLYIRWERKAEFVFAVVLLFRFSWIGWLYYFHNKPIQVH